MDLKFTFQESRQLPLTEAPTQASSELFIDLPDPAAAAETPRELRAVAVSGDGVTYASAERAVRAGEEFHTAVRSVLARAVAEVGEPLSRSITALRVGAEVHLALQQLGAVDAAGTGTTAVLELRAGITPATRVELAL